MLARHDKTRMPSPDEAAAGARHAHAGSGAALRQRPAAQAALPEGMQQAMFAMGCFRGAEDYHQQYLAKNPGGYCGIGGTGVSCAVRAAPERTA